MRRAAVALGALAAVVGMAVAQSGSTPSSSTYTVPLGEALARAGRRGAGGGAGASRIGSHSLARPRLAASLVRATAGFFRARTREVALLVD